MHQAGNRFVEIARIGKAHGLYGAVRLIIDDEAPSFIKEGALLFLENRRGDKIPARIEEIRIEEKHNTQSFFVKFDQIADRSQAESYQDTAVYADRLIEAKRDTALPDVTGYQIVEMKEENPVGLVREVMENPAHPILVVEMDLKEVLIPWVDYYVQHIDHERRLMRCHNLNQLMNL